LIKPTTYVNLSGIAAEDFFDHHEIDITEFLVVTDDVNLDEGKIRIRKSGGDGGHNGIHSLIYHLGSELFPRIRFGVGNKFDKGEMADYVLSPFSEDNIEQINNQIDFAVELMEKFIINDFQTMLDYYSKSLQNKINSNNGEGK
jgi:PTH1 family peptidyl-tRNA hydrolase